VPFENALPLVAGLAATAVVAVVLWLRTMANAWLVLALVATLAGAAALTADLCVVTDREALEELFPRLARAAEAGDVETVLAAIDPAAGQLRTDAERALARARATSVWITKLEIDLPPGRAPRTARVDLIVRVTGNWIDGGSGTGIVRLDVHMRKDGDRWLVTAADGVPIGAEQAIHHRSSERSRTVEHVCPSRMRGVPTGKPAAFPPVGQVDKGHGRLCPRTARARLA